MTEAGGTASGWQLQGSAADAYEEYLVPAIFRACAVRLLDVVGVEEGQRVLDVACGTGVVARLAADRVGASGEVTGVDVNPEMLATARRAANALGPSAAVVEWREADVASLPFADGRFDVVLCQEAVQFFPDRGAASVRCGGSPDRAVASGSAPSARSTTIPSTTSSPASSASTWDRPPRR